MLCGMTSPIQLIGGRFGECMTPSIRPSGFVAFGNCYQCVQILASRKECTWIQVKGAREVPPSSPTHPNSRPAVTCRWSGQPVISSSSLAFLQHDSALATRMHPCPCLVIKWL